MPNQSKPDVNTIWASGGEATPVPPAKQALGYIEEIPFYDDFNGHMQQISQFMKHVNQEGICLWDAATTYAVGSFCKSPVDGNGYKALSESTGVPPITVIGGAVSAAWVRWTYTLPEITNEISSMFCAMVVPLAVVGLPASSGWLLCDGQAVSRATYARLFARIGISAGPGNGTTTFNLPDMRGEVVRGLDLGRGVDPSRELLSAQGDALANHAHFLPTSNTTPGTRWTIPDNIWTQNEGNENPRAGEYARTYQTSDEGNFAGETRMRNLAVPYYIKY